MDKKPKDELIKKDHSPEIPVKGTKKQDDTRLERTHRGYYYDDSHGYQRYIPEIEDCEEEEEGEQ